MKQEYKILLLGLIAITVIDSGGSIVSREINLNYTLLAPISFLVYGAVGFFAARKSDFKTAILFSASTGLFDSTIGWAISMLFKANTGNVKNDPTIGQWIIIVVIVTISAALVGVIGGWLATITARKTQIID